MKEIKSGDVVYLKSDTDKQTKINVGHKTAALSDVFNCYWFTQEGLMGIAELPVQILTKS